MGVWHTKHNKTYLRVTAGWPDGGSYVVHCNVLKQERGRGMAAGEGLEGSSDDFARCAQMICKRVVGEVCGGVHATVERFVKG